MRLQIRLALVASIVVAVSTVPGVWSQESAGLAGGGTTELVLAMFGIDAEDLLLGGIPEENESLILVPPESRIIGSLAREGSLSVVVESALSTADLAAWIDRNYRATGWMAIEYRRHRGGFNPSPSEMPIQFCREGEQVNVSLADGREGSRVRYHHYANPGMSQSCEDTRRGMEPLGDFEFPQLAAPTGSEQRGSSSCGGGNEQSIGTGLTTDLSAVEVLDHYSTQLRDAGWLPVASCWDGPVAVHAWRVERSEGESVDGLLIVSETAAATQVHLSASRGGDR